MAAPDLTGRTISSTFGELLKTTNTAGITSTLDTVVDGNANVDSALQISTAGVKSTGTLEVTGATTLSTDLTLATGATVTGINDTDAFSDASATTLATSESVKAYADANVMEISTFAVGDLLYASTTSALTKLVAGGTGNVLKISGGLPAWGAVSGTGTVTSVTGGNGLSGGEIVGAGTLAVDITGATDGTGITVDSANDELLVYDNDATAVKKITVSQLPGGGDTLPIVDSTAVVKDGDKLVRIDAGALTADTTKVITMGDRDVDLASGGTFAERVHTHSYVALDAEDQTFTKGVRGEMQAVTVDTGADTATCDLNDSNNFAIPSQAAASTEIKFSNLDSDAVGQSGVIVLTHAGGATTFNTVFQFPAGTVPTVNTSGTDIVAYYVESATRVSAVFHGNMTRA